MKRVIFSILLSLILIMMLSGCGEVSIHEAILGEWELAQESEDVSQRHYPEARYMIFEENNVWKSRWKSDAKWKEGTYLLDTATITLDRDNVFPYTYKIEISEDRLMLEWTGDEPIYFNRVKK